MTEPCICSAAGWCERHQIDKGARQFELCRTREDYRAMWDARLKTVNCRDWKEIGTGIFQCPHCGGTAMSLSADEITPRRCETIVRYQVQPAAAGCGGCGGSWNSPATPSIVESPALTLGEKAGTFAGAMLDFATDPRLADANARLAICETCDERDGHTCKVCGCYLPIKARAAAWHCPLAKWPGDDADWTPAVHANLLARTLVVVPCRGKVAMTQNCVRDCFKERVRVLVVDNEGDYEAVGNEDVVRTRRGGWGDACNLGFVSADAMTYCVILNNDTRLSPNFFAGLIVAQRATKAAAVAASYNVGWHNQRTRDQYNGPAADYKPKPFHFWSGYCDGTAVLMTMDAVRAVGHFDESVSPTFNWNLEADWCIRAKKLGYRIAITEASYVYHLNMQTAKEVYGGVEKYVEGAIAEAQEGMRKKWGDGFKNLANAIELPREFTKRNLVYHVAAFKTTDNWKRNIEQLSKRKHVFTGRKQVTIATGESLENPQAVKNAFAGWSDVEFYEVANSRTLRENVNSKAMLERIESEDQGEITFFAHTKGVSTPGSSEGVMLWRNSMYHALLDNMQEVELALSHKPVVGTHRVHKVANFPDGSKSGEWHFAGTFFWLRNADVFGRKDWRELIQQTGWGMEAFPGLTFKYEDSHCMAYDNPINPYNPGIYAGKEIRDEAGPSPSAAQKIELGGGKNPRGDGFVNIDHCDTADVRMELDTPDVKLPYETDSVQHVCSAHLFEHIKNLKPLLWELVRVCAIGARVEITVPHWASSMAMCHDHKQTISPEQVAHWSDDATHQTNRDYWWKGSAKRLLLQHTEFRPGAAYFFWYSQFPNADHQDILKFCPDACHEVLYAFTVRGND